MANNDFDVNVGIQLNLDAAKIKQELEKIDIEGIIEEKIKGSFSEGLDSELSKVKGFITQLESTLKGANIDISSLDKIKTVMDSLSTIAKEDFDPKMIKEFQAAFKSFSESIEQDSSTIKLIETKLLGLSETIDTIAAKANLLNKTDLIKDNSGDIKKQTSALEKEADAIKEIGDEAKIAADKMDELDKPKTETVNDDSAEKLENSMKSSENAVDSATISVEKQIAAVKTLLSEILAVKNMYEKAADSSNKMKTPAKKTPSETKAATNGTEAPPETVTNKDDTSKQSEKELSNLKRLAQQLDVTEAEILAYQSAISHTGATSAQTIADMHNGWQLIEKDLKAQGFGFEELEGHFKRIQSYYLNNPDKMLSASGTIAADNKSKEALKEIGASLDSGEISFRDIAVAMEAAFGDGAVSDINEAKQAIKALMELKPDMSGYSKIEKVLKALKNPGKTQQLTIDADNKVNDEKIKSTGSGIDSAIDEDRKRALVEEAITNEKKIQTAHAENLSTIYKKNLSLLENKEAAMRKTIKYAEDESAAGVEALAIQKKLNNEKAASSLSAANSIGAIASTDTYSSIPEQERTAELRKQIALQDVLKVKQKQSNEISSAINRTEEQRSNKQKEINILYEQAISDGLTQKAAKASMVKYLDNQEAREKAVLSVKKAQTAEIEKQKQASLATKISSYNSTGDVAPSSLVSQADSFDSQSTELKAELALYKKIKDEADALYAVEKAIDSNKESMTQHEKDLYTIYKQELGKLRDKSLAIKEASKYAGDELKARKKATTVLDDTNTLHGKIGGKLKQAMMMYIGIDEAIQAMATGLRNGLEYITEIDSHITAIQMVNDDLSRTGVSELTQQYEDLALSLSKTSNEVGEVAESLARQGLASDAMNYRLELFTKLSAVLGSDVHETTDQMTAMTNSLIKGSTEYNAIISSGMSDKEKQLALTQYTNEEMSRSADIITKLGASAATSGEEIFMAIQKNASVAGEAGVQIEDLARMTAIVSEKTRQTPEQIGTAFKTIISKFMQVKNLDGELGKVLATIEEVGVEIKTFSDDGGVSMRGFTEIIQDLATEWDDYSDIQQNAIGTALGVRQLDRFAALMSGMSTELEGGMTRWEQLGEAVEDSVDTVDNQFARYEDSVEASSNRMRAAWQDLFSDIVTSDNLKGLYDFAASLAEIEKNSGLLSASLAVVSTVMISSAVRSFTGYMVKLAIATGMETTAVGGLSGAFATLNAVMGPIGWTIAAVGAAAIVLPKIIDGLTTSTEEYKTKLTETTNSMLDVQSEIDSLLIKKQELKDDFRDTSAIDIEIAKNEELLNSYKNIADANSYGVYKASLSEDNAITGLRDSGYKEKVSDISNQQRVFQSGSIDDVIEESDDLNLATNKLDLLKKLRTEITEIMGGLDKDNSKELDHYNKLSGKLGTVNQKIESANTLYSEQYEELVALENPSEEMIALKDEMSKELTTNMYQEFAQGVKDTTEAFESNEFSKTAHMYNELGEAMQDTTSAADKLNTTSLSDFTAEIDSLRASSTVAGTTADELGEDYSLLKESVVTLTDAYPQLAQEILANANSMSASEFIAYLNTLDETETKILEASAATELLESSTDELNSTIDNMQSGMQEASDLSYELSQGYKLTTSDMIDLIQKYPQLSSEIENANGSREGALALSEAMFEAEKQLAKMELDRQKATAYSMNAENIAKRDELNAMMAASPSTFWTNEASRTAWAGINSALSGYDKVVSSIKTAGFMIDGLEMPDFIPSGSTGSSGASTAAKEYEDYYEQLKKIEELDSEIGLMETTDDILVDQSEELVSLYRERQEMLHILNDERRADLLLLEEEILKTTVGTEEYNELIAERADLLSDKAGASSQWLSDEASAIAELIEASKEYAELMSKSESKSSMIDSTLSVLVATNVEGNNDEAIAELYAEKKELISDSIDIQNAEIEIITSRLKTVKDNSKEELALTERKMELEKERNASIVEMWSNQDEANQAYEDSLQEQLDLLEKQQSEFEDVQDDIVDALKSKYEEDLENFTDAEEAKLEEFEKRSEARIDIYDDEIDALNNAKDAADQEDEQADYQEEVDDLTSQINILSGSDGANEKAKVKALEEERADILEEMRESAEDYNHDQKIAAIETQKDIVQAQIDANQEAHDDKIELLEAEYEAKLKEEALYTEAQTMLQRGQYDEITELLTQYNTDFISQTAGGIASYQANFITALQEISTYMDGIFSGQFNIDIDRITNEIDSLNDNATTSKNTSVKYHTGGYVGDAPLKPNEVPTILEKGELVLTNSQLEKYRDAASTTSTSGNNFTIDNFIKVDAELNSDNDIEMTSQKLAALTKKKLNGVGLRV